MRKLKRMFYWMGLCDVNKHMYDKDFTDKEKERYLCYRFFRFKYNKYKGS